MLIVLVKDVVVLLSVLKSGKFDHQKVRFLGKRMTASEKFVFLHLEKGGDLGHWLG